MYTWRCNDNVCMIVNLKGVVQDYGVRLFLNVCIKSGWNTSVAVGLCPRCNDELLNFFVASLV